MPLLLWQLRCGGDDDGYDIVSRSTGHHAAKIWGSMVVEGSQASDGSGPCWLTSTSEFHFHHSNPRSDLTELGARWRYSGISGTWYLHALIGAGFLWYAYCNFIIALVMGDLEPRLRKGAFPRDGCFQLCAQDLATIR
ncbi:hypothetical protein K402DRAFT_130896 [Aulographum hederae CBS 113979]|uniref:Uncharacterized protein n=1 Tax=Aulographum hederae CBS 113979 TaxID=1176131 RepID=A0A6G1HF07_9PEZI|nr:hypothetical protein K402DRAFT_130896 [Aulographum hederae CBS 113979]